MGKQLLWVHLLLPITLLISTNAYAADLNDLFSDKNGFSISSGTIKFSDDQKKNWKPIQTNRYGTSFEWAESTPQSEIGGNNDRHRLHVEYADTKSKSKSIARVTRVHDERRNLFAFAQNLGAETLKFTNGVPSSFTDCSVYKRQDFREQGRTYPHETAGDVIAGTFGSKSEVAVRAECDRIDDKVCNAIRVWSAAHGEKSLEECAGSLGSLALLTANDDAAAAGEKKIVLDEFKKLNNSTNPLWNRKLEYNDKVIADAFNAKEAKSELGATMRRVSKMLRACDTLGWPKKPSTFAKDAARSDARDATRR